MVQVVQVVQAMTNTDAMMDLITSSLCDGPKFDMELTAAISTDAFFETLPMSSVILQCRGDLVP